MTLSWPWPILSQGQIGSLRHLYGEKEKLWPFWTFINTNNQRSRSFTYLGPRSLIFSSFEIFSKSSMLIETKLHIKHQWVWKIKVCSWDLDHMTKIAVMPIYGKKFFQFFVSGIERQMTLKLGMQHMGLWLYLVYSNDDPWLTFAYFTTRSI